MKLPILNVKVRRTHIIVSFGSVPGREPRGTVRSPRVTVRWFHRLTLVTVRT